VMDICVQFLFLIIIFSVLMTQSACGITSIIQKWLDKLKTDMISDMVTLKQGKTDCR